MERANFLKGLLISSLALGTFALVKPYKGLNANVRTESVQASSRIPNSMVGKWYGRWNYYGEKKSDMVLINKRGITFVNLIQFHHHLSKKGYAKAVKRYRKNYKRTLKHDNTTGDEADLPSKPSKSLMSNGIHRLKITKFHKKGHEYDINAKSYDGDMSLKFAVSGNHMSVHDIYGGEIIFFSRHGTHKYSKKVVKHSNKSGLSNAAEYKTGEEQGKHYITVPNTYPSGTPFSKYISVGKELNNKAFRAGFHKGQLKETKVMSFTTSFGDTGVMNALRNLGNHPNKQYRKGWLDRVNTLYSDYTGSLKTDGSHSPLAKGRPASHNSNYMKGWKYANKELNGVFTE